MNAGSWMLLYLKYTVLRDAWLAPSEERATLNLAIVSSSLMLGVEMTKIKIKNKT